LDRIIDETTVQLLICKLNFPVNTIKRLVVAISANAEHEAGFPGWVNTILQLTKEAGARLTIYSTEKTFKALNDYNTNSDAAIEIFFIPFYDWDDFLILTKEIEKNDLFMAVLARQHTLAYHPGMDKIPRYLSRYFKEVSFAVLYPEQIWTNKLS